MSRLLLALAFAALASQADAATTAYLTRTGSGSACTQATPCASMASALTAAQTGGEVICLDRGDYGATAINNSVTIMCGDGLWTVTGAVQVSMAPPAGSHIVIEGLAIDLLGAAGGSAILYSGQGSLELRNVRAGNRTGTGNCLNFQPTGPSSLHVSNSYFHDCTGAAGITINPTGASAYVNAHIRSTKFARNSYGLFAQGSSSTIGLNINVDNCASVDNSQHGFVAITSAAGDALTTLSIRNTQISGNLQYGVVSQGPKSVVELHNSMVTANFFASNFNTGGTLNTFSNNMFRLNGAPPSFTGTKTLQ
jgi:hypothetical protein